MKTILGIPVVEFGHILAFLDDKPVSRWEYSKKVSIPTAVRWGWLAGNLLKRLRSYCYKPRVMQVTPPGKGVEYRIVHSGAPYATNLVWTQDEDGGIYLLVVFESKAGTRAVTANFPTGLIEHFEKANAAAARETQEETELVVNPSYAGSCFVWASRHDNSPDGNFHAFFTNADPTIYIKSPAPERGETVTMAWLSIFDAYQMMERGEPVRFEIDAVAALQLASLQCARLAEAAIAYHDTKQHHAPGD